MPFKHLGLPTPIIEWLDQHSFKNTTPVQKAVIPKALHHEDLLVCAKTGSGKTLSFLIPVFTHLLTSPDPQGIKFLILCPTRELAIQIYKIATDLSQSIPSKVELLIGGDGYQKQYQRLQRPIDVLIATPGRLLRHLIQGHLQLNKVRTVIIDEADRTLDMGFVDDVHQILRYTPKERQTCLFSATLDESVKHFAYCIQKNAFSIESDPPKEPHSQIIQGYLNVPQHHSKTSYLIHLLHHLEYSQCMIFCATRKQAEQVCDQLNISGILSIALHGDMPQKDRKDMMRLYRSKQVNVLVTTDLLARGIDQISISHVIHFNLPDACEDYIHRIGRTARGKQMGYTLCLLDSEQDKTAFAKLQDYLGYKIAPFKKAPF